MRLRPWHIIVVVVILSSACISTAFFVEERPKDILLGIGTNLLSSVVFFILLEVYWERIQRANGKEINGFDYLRFARNISKSNHVRILGTFIYPLTQHPKHESDRTAILQALRDVTRRPHYAGVQILFLDPASAPARNRAEERKDDDVLSRMREGLLTLHELIQSLGGVANCRIEVRLFSRMPAFALFQTDNFASISFYYRDRPISEVTRYEFFTDTPLGVFVERTFEDLWRDERTWPLERWAEQQAPSSPDERAGHR
jgi:hypothetical protein